MYSVYTKQRSMLSENPFSKELKRFSIITPVYGDSWKTFEKYFQSLDQQDYKAFEVVIVFDGENLIGEEELAKYTKLYPHLDVVSYTKPWGGAPSARNYGADRATGDFLSFIDPDVYLYTETLRFWANAFEENPDKDVVWGLYDIIVGDQKQPIGGWVPKDAKGVVDYWAFRFSNYCSGANPLRKEAFVRWDETVRSLQDWDMWIRMLLKDNFEGKKFLYFHRPFFLTEPPHVGGISDDSHKNWKERVKYVREKNGIPLSKIVVTSGGAPYHGMHIAKKLGADYLPDPTYKPNDYETLYLLGYYTGSKEAFAYHANMIINFTGKNRIVHWIGTDVYELYNKISVQTMIELRSFWKRYKVRHLAEIKHIQEELKELEVKAEVVPIPPPKLYEPMPLPEEFAVGIYENPTQRMYGEDLMMEIVRSMPDVKFYFFGSEDMKGQKSGNMEHLGWIDFDEWMPKFSLNLRITTHDGLPLTPVQFLTAGRSVITNTNLKGADVVDGKRKEIVELIRRAKKNAPWADTRVTSQYWIDALDFQVYKEAIEKII